MGPSWIFNYFVISSYLFICLTQGVSGTAFVKVSLVNTTVVKGGYFEIQLKQISPTWNKNNWDAGDCGFDQPGGGLSVLTYWWKFSNPTTWKLKKNIDRQYRGRVAVRNLAVTRINNATFNDEGKMFYCQLKYINTTFGVLDTVSSNKIKLDTVYVKPEITQDALNSSIEMSAGQIITLECNFTGRPKVNISWVYPNVLKGNETSTYYDGSGLTWTTGSFNITTVPKVCENYKVTCIGQNQFGRAEQSTMLNITLAPQIRNASITQTVDEGDQVVLLCNASGCPTPIITWKKTGNDTFSHTGQTIKFSSVSHADHGEYICNAAAKGRLNTEKGNLTVHFKPTAMSLTSNATKNKTEVNSIITINCSSEARPIANYLFYQNGHLKQNDTLNSWSTPSLSCPSSSNSENFTCVAYNMVGNTSKTLSLLVIEKPSINEAPKSKYIRNETNSITLNCSASGCPKPEITWKKVGNTSILHKGSSYNLMKISPKDDAEYICIATSAGFTVNTTTALTVHYRPTLNRTSSKNLTTCINETVILHCATSSSYPGFPPPRLTLLNESGTILKETNNSILSYILNVSSVADFQKYYCTSFNMLGFDKIDIIVNTTVKPTKPRDLRVTVDPGVITWKEPKCAGEKGIKRYNVYYKNKNNIFIKKSSKCCKYKIKNLKAYSQYLVKLAAVDNQNREGEFVLIEFLFKGYSNANRMDDHDNVFPDWAYVIIVIISCGSGGLIIFVIIKRKNKKVYHKDIANSDNIETAVNMDIYILENSGAEGEHYFGPDGQSTYAAVSKNSSKKQENNVQSYLAPDGSSEYAAVNKPKKAGPDVASEYETVSKKGNKNRTETYKKKSDEYDTVGNTVGGEYDTVGNTVGGEYDMVGNTIGGDPEKKDSNYAALGPFSDSPTNVNPKSCEDQSEYSQIDSLGPLKCYDNENETTINQGLSDPTH